jgi:hypothetical protein
MNVAIIIGVAEYSGGLERLPACKTDVELLRSIVASTKKFDEQLVIASDTSSAEVKAKLTDFVQAHKGKDIEEVLFYYSGHGEFDGEELHYLLSDFDSRRKKQTSLENSELDNMMRALQPALAIKVVDACQSGVPYIKNAESLSGYLKGTGGRFHKCYFMFSSQTDQSSYQDEELSFFTRGIVRAVIELPGPTIRYKDLIDYLSDYFEADSKQQPFFVVQAHYTEPFCTVSETMRTELTARLSDISAPAKEDAGPRQIPLQQLVEEEARDYCTVDESLEILETFLGIVRDGTHPEEAKDLFSIECDPATHYSGIHGLNEIAKWLNEHEHNYFAEAVLEDVREPDPLAILAAALLRTSTKQVAPDAKMRTVKKPMGVRPTVEVPFTHIVLAAKPKYSNLHRSSLTIIPLVSKTHVRFFVSSVCYEAVGATEERVRNRSPWRMANIKLRDDVRIRSWLQETIASFWRDTLDPIKQRFGLLPSEDREAAEQTADNGTTVNRAES